MASSEVEIPEMFRAYEADLRRYLDGLEQRVPGLRPSDTAERTEAERTAGLAEQALQHLEMELRTSPSTVKEVLRPKVRDYKNAISAVRKGLRKLSEEGQRSDLLNNEQQRHNTQMRAMDEQMERGERVLAGAQDEALKAETVGQEIMGDLSRQREVMHRAKRNMGLLEDELDVSNQALDDIMGSYRRNSRVVNLVFFMTALAAFTVYFIRTRGSDAGS
eukprot:GEMP01062752.1.p1 GENE.GEMP01062752.1~~GEMP01062752.1.p1  ORF type:complete len:219 (+),score=56.49 GEMP01062752.1:72-728(+)